MVWPDLARKDLSSIYASMVCWQGGLLTVWYVLTGHCCAAGLPQAPHEHSGPSSEPNSGKRHCHPGVFELVSSSCLHVQSWSVQVVEHGAEHVVAMCVQPTRHQVHVLLVPTSGCTVWFRAS
jgi:hypothetical protein